jgi:glycosyltransferase involved in cell wall biosynthesis
VRAKAAALGVGDRVRSLGYVEPEELVGLYRLARFVVVPSLFEGGAFPLLEAFREGTPVACSNATALLEVGGDAVLLFDPLSVEEIADTLPRLAAEEALRQELRGAGAARAALFDWSATADSYRQLYRSLERHSTPQIGRPRRDRG